MINSFFNLKRGFFSTIVASTLLFNGCGEFYDRNTSTKIDIDISQGIPLKLMFLYDKNAPKEWSSAKNDDWTEGDWTEDAAIEHRKRRLYNEDLAFLNKVYGDANVSFSIVGFEPFDMGIHMENRTTEHVLDEILHKNITKDLREIYDADIIVFMKYRYRESNIVGTANINFGLGSRISELGSMDISKLKSSLFGVVRYEGAASVIAHELGHVFGLTHGNPDDSMYGAFKFGRGYAINGQFASIMTYPYLYNVSSPSTTFSNVIRPNEGDNEHNSIRALNITGSRILELREY